MMELDEALEWLVIYIATFILFGLIAHWGQGPIIGRIFVLTLVIIALIPQTDLFKRYFPRSE